MGMVINVDTACCFFGHRDIFENIESDLENAVIKVIENSDVKIFMVGDHGRFDALCASTVRKLKKRYKDVKLYLVKAYFSNELNTNKIYYEQLYDDVIVPDVVLDAHYKTAIGIRNRWMIDNSSYVITYVRRDFGGAYKAEKYAEKESKAIIKI